MASTMLREIIQAIPAKLKTMLPVSIGKFNDDKLSYNFINLSVMWLHIVF